MKTFTVLFFFAPGGARFSGVQIPSLPGYGKTSLTVSFALAEPELVQVHLEPIQGKVEENPELNALYQSFGWLDPDNQWMTLTIPGMFGAIMTAFFIRQFLFGLPTSIIEAAKIDGAGYFRIFTGFILPLAMPAIVAQGLLSFMGCWNNYMGSLIYTTPTSSLWVNLPHAMAIMNTNNPQNQGPVMAAAVMCVLPVIILFAIFQKMIIGSLMLTGSKE